MRLGCGFRQPNSETEFGASVKVTPPYGCNAGSVQQRADVPKAWLPPTKFRAEIWGVSHGHRPLRIEGEVSATTQASGAQRSVCAAGAKKWVGIATEVNPKGAINAGQSLSHGCAVPAPFTQGSLALRGTGDADCHVGPAGLLAMTPVFCHSEASAHTGRGNPSFLRWMGIRAAEVVGPYEKEG